ncbi:Lrp/AsnC family transcriptional regulator [uncultured Sphingomonas sp.]|uniref:Lrp/AsnC family transcriptional regulator n=1 Tax=uncultured Sphingomonas sp. TaxID=158754 RepID=UPI0025D06B70|nr:Lrp/AsnC family transcriptional regulator [uncultured Sphingomonas sp.]
MTRPTLTSVDFGLLESLERNGRQSFATLATEHGLSKTPCWNRVQAMEEAGVIRGYRADIDPAALGLSVIAHVQVAIDASQRDAFEAAVMDDAAILECHSIAGDADYLFKIACRDVEALDDLLRDRLTLLPGVTRTRTTISLKAIKPPAPLSRAVRHAGATAKHRTGLRR